MLPIFNYISFFAPNLMILLKFWDLRGAKVCKSCRSRKMLKNAPTLAIVAVHTAENEPSKVGAEMPHLVELARLPLAATATFGGSFSAVWTATIASKDAFFSIFRDLQDLHSFAPLRSQNLSKKSFGIFSENLKFPRIERCKRMQIL